MNYYKISKSLEDQILYNLVFGLQSFDLVKQKSVKQKIEKMKKVYWRVLIKISNEDYLFNKYSLINESISRKN